MPGVRGAHRVLSSRQHNPQPDGAGELLYRFALSVEVVHDDHIRVSLDGFRTSC
jgi:hypothetical protein